jgi:hypothetical protein
MNGGSSNDQRSGEELLWKRVQCLAHSGCIRLKQSLTLAFKGRSKKVHAQRVNPQPRMGQEALALPPNQKLPVPQPWLSRLNMTCIKQCHFHRNLPVSP